MDQGLKIDAHVRGPVTVLRLTGFFAHLEVYHLKNRIEGQLENGRKLVVVNLAAISFIDSAGMGALFQARKTCIQAGGNLFLVAPMVVHARQAMAMAAVDKMIPTLNDEDEACQALARQYGMTLETDGDAATQQRRADKASGDDALEPKLQVLSARVDALEIRLDEIELRVAAKAPAPPDQSASLDAGSGKAAAENA
jgi:stage II sporulation protein AA (anti-sigma F factor antagonist)